MICFPSIEFKLKRADFCSVAAFVQLARVLHRYEIIGCWEPIGPSGFGQEIEKAVSSRIGGGLPEVFCSILPGV